MLPTSLYFECVELLDNLGHAAFSPISFVFTLCLLGHTLAEAMCLLMGPGSPCISVNGSKLILWTIA